MNLPDAYYLDDKDPETPYQPTNKRDQSYNLDGLRVGYNPESGFKAVLPPLDNL